MEPVEKSRTTLLVQSPDKCRGGVRGAGCGKDKRSETEPGSPRLKDTELIVALWRQHGGPQLPQHVGGVLQRVHQLVLVLKHRGQRSQADSCCRPDSAPNLPSIASSGRTGPSRPGPLRPGASPAHPEETAGWWAATQTGGLQNQNRTRQGNQNQSRTRHKHLNQSRTA